MIFFCKINRFYLFNNIESNNSIANYIHVSVHFLCLPKENEPKEKALSRQVFFKERLKNRPLKTIF